MTITIQLTSDEEQRLKKLADDAGITVQELVHQVIKAGIEYPSDKEFRAAMKQILSENAELYKRLAK